MHYVDALTPRDQQLAAEKLAGFLPSEIYDIHTHPHHPGHFPPGTWAFLDGMRPLGCAEHRQALQRYMPVATIHGLYFGMPRKTADRPAMNALVAGSGTAVTVSLPAWACCSNTSSIWWTILRIGHSAAGTPGRARNGDPVRAGWGLWQS